MQVVLVVPYGQPLEVMVRNSGSIAFYTSIFRRNVRLRMVVVSKLPFLHNHLLQQMQVLVPLQGR